MPTRAGWSVIVASIASCTAGWAFGALELYVLGATGLVAVAIATAWVGAARPEVAIGRQVVPPHVAVGGPARVELTVDSGRRRVPPLTLIDPVSSTVGARLVVGPLPAAASTVTGYRLPTGRRGLLEVGPLRPEVGDPFGLARRRLPSVAGQRIFVLPAIEVIPPIPVGSGGRALGAGAGRRASAPSANDDLVSLRPYVVGDDLRRVHWPSSARGDDLVVRRDEHDRPGRCLVVLDARREAIGPDAFERAVSAAASLVQAGAESGDRLRLVVTDGTDTGLVDARRAGTGLLERLAVVERHQEPPGATAIDADEADAVVLLSGERAAPPGELEADPWVEVRFAEGDAAVPGADRVLLVGPDESFATVWTGWLASRMPGQAPR